MTQEQEAHAFHRDVGKILEKNLRTIGNYINDKRLWLIFDTREPWSASNSNQLRDTANLQFTPQDQYAMTQHLQKYMYNTIHIQKELPANWALPELNWYAPKTTGDAETMAKQFNIAADGLKEKIKTLPFDAGLRGVGQRLVEFLGI
jgi:hypothetical protein